MSRLATPMMGCAMPLIVRHPPLRPGLPGHDPRHLPRRCLARGLPSLISDAISPSSPTRDLLAAAFAITGSKLIVQIFDRLEAAAIIDRNLSRKLVHTLAGPLFLVSWPLFASNPESKLIAAAVPFLNVIRLTLVGTGLVRDERVVAAMSRTGDKSELLRGPLFYVLVLFAVTLACWRNSPIGLVVIAVLCGGDGLADIFGRRFGGGARLPWNQAKSWAGSAAMLGGSLMVAASLISFYHLLGLVPHSLQDSLGPVAIIAAVSTGVESLPISQRLDDNLSVPAVALLLGSTLLP
ncbi:KATL5 [Auxenochlorella protothecoides x Auxenochlorella symbiontica]